MIAQCYECDGDLNGPYCPACNPGILTPAESQIVLAARDLVALWQSPRIQGLPRSERNAAIDETRTRLINAVDALDSGPYPDDLVEAVTRAMVDCHDRCDHHASYKDYIEWEKGSDEHAEMAREWLAARRLEAKAAIAIMNR